ncbi:DnaB-like helicase N-terminal domain-containing protein [Streptomyces sp. NPDC046860]|uniref:DnaB-like helicase N-terminal domain-containing protein n=1 Tax=Streptomyces sp. NPDC046860 TaxID=3154495 RepID=UPI003404774B
MLHPPTSYEDHTAPGPPPEPGFYAEQALLGALLLEPPLLDEISGIEPDSFSRPAHTALFTAIRSLPAPDPEQHTETVAWLDRVLTAAREHVRGLDAPYLHALIQFSPMPRHASAYARTVEAGHARRLLRTAAQRLAHSAQDLTHPHSVPAALAEADNLAAVTDTIAARFPPHPGSVPRTPSTPPAEKGDSAEAAEEERLLLATATAHPEEAKEMRWLTAADFTHPLHAGLWQSLAFLLQRRLPVDPVTVLCEAQQRGLLTADGDTDSAALLRLLADPLGSPQHWGERILERSLLATARGVGHRVGCYTADPATTPYQLVVGSRRALADLSAIRARWQHATSPAPPRPAHPKTTAPRAGPPRTRAATVTPPAR